MQKLTYEAPALDVCLFEPEDVISNSIIIDPIPGDGVVDDDDW